LNIACGSYAFLSIKLFYAKKFYYPSSCVCGVSEITKKMLKKHEWLRALWSYAITK